MAETDFWAENNFKDQVQEAKELIKLYQDNRKFAFELIIAVFGLGFFINLFTSFLYDVYIKREIISRSFEWLIFLTFFILVLVALIIHIFSRYSPKKPIILKFFFNPMKYNSYLQEIEPELTEILDDSKKEVINEIYELLKNRIDDRPPMKRYWRLKNEVLDTRWMTFYYEGFIYDVKTSLDITFGIRSRLLKDNYWMAINIKILKPYLSGIEGILEESTFMVIMQDILYALETAIRQFLKIK